MVKVMWFLKRANHLTLSEFRSWWLDDHIHLIAQAQSPYLRKYVVNVREDDDTLAGRPEFDCEWDGVAEQWFDDEAAFNAAYSKPTAPVTREDSRKHTSRMERIIVREHEVGLPAQEGNLKCPPSSH